MASLIDDPSGRRRIVIMCPDGKRRPLRLGKISRRDAEAIRLHVESLAAAARSGRPLAESTEEFLIQIPDAHHAKLAELGLCAPRKSSTLAAFLQSYMSGLQVKPATITNYGHAARTLRESLGSQTPMAAIRAGDAVLWRQHLIDSGLARATVNRRITTAKAFFAAAVRQGIIRESPLAGLTGGTQINHARQFFVTREAVSKLIDAAPDAQWRLLIALSRFAGLRTPSEPLLLTWADIDWDRNRMTIHSPKTEHHPGQDSRVIPIFPEVMPALRECYDLAEPGSQYVITRYRSAAANLRTQLQRIATRAGVKPWPKLWHNMRASRQTELAEAFPMQVVCAWIGNSAAVARDHYLQVTDDHFSRAAGDASQAKAARFAARNASAGERSDAQPESASDGKMIEKGPDFASLHPGAPHCADEKMGGMGLKCPVCFVVGSRRLIIKSRLNPPPRIRDISDPSQSRPLLGQAPRWPSWTC